MLKYVRELPLRTSVALRSLAAEERGQGLIEYALIVSLIALVAIAALTTTGTSLKSILTKISGDV